MSLAWWIVVSVLYLAVAVAAAAAMHQNAKDAQRIAKNMAGMRTAFRAGFARATVPEPPDVDAGPPSPVASAVAGLLWPLMLVMRVAVTLFR